MTDRDALVNLLTRLRAALASDGHVWVSWPTQAAGNESDLDEHGVRAAGLEFGFVDTKACAVDEVWSGLKLVIRKELR